MRLVRSDAEAIEVITGNSESARASIIWLHGLGADGNDFVPIVQELGLPAGIRIIFPHAPVRPITLNMGYMMRGWYDLASLELTQQEDQAGIQNSAETIQALIAREEVQGIASNNIVLAGFSQGGAIALYAGLTCKKPLAGIMALSTYLPLADKIAIEEVQKKTPIFMAHGTQDDIVRYRYGTQSRDRLQAVGCPVEWHEFPMTHAVCPEEVDTIRQWLNTVLKV